MKKIDPRFPDTGGIALQSHGDGKEIRNILGAVYVLWRLSPRCERCKAILGWEALNCRRSGDAAIRES